MALCWPSLFLLLSLFSTHANAANINLTAELTNFVPACAQECFESFLDSNFPTSVCTSDPTLACLCSNNSTSGYTVGEGAFQCIVSEDSISGCQGVDANEEVVVDAYTMCNGQADALPNTHSTITATLIVQSSIVLIAPIPTTTYTSNSKIPSSAGVTSSRTTASSTHGSQTATASPTQNSTTAASTSAQAASKPASTTPTLTKSQIVGITVASVGGTAIAIGILILFACWRRRRERARDSDMLPFQMDPSYRYEPRAPTETVKQCKGPGGTANGLAAKVAPPVPPRIDTGSPNMFARRSILPDTIGLAISPERNEHAYGRHSSKLLPEKPILTLQVPQQAFGKVDGAQKFSQPVHQASANSRQSTATQFEDVDSADTAVAGQEDWGRDPKDQILNNQTGKWTTIRPVPPDSRHIPQVVVSPTDWKPPNPHSNKAATSLVPVFEVKPLKIGRSIGSFSRPLVVGNDPFPRPTPPAQLQIPPQTNRPIRETSSIYSTHNSLPPSDAGRNPKAARRKSYKQSGPYDRQVSTGSLTSFETVDTVTSPQDLEPKTAGTDLSPVVESPASGKSPVSYPKIPGRLSREYIRMVPPPPQPDFGAVFSSQSGMKPWKIAEINAQRERDIVQAHAHRQNQNQSQGLGIGQQGVQRQLYLNQQRNYVAPSAVYKSAPSQKQPPASNPYYPYQTPQYLPARPGPLTQNPADSRSSSMVSDNSNASSLLAKRRGEQKAQALKLMNEDDKKRQQAKWRVLKGSDIERAKSPTWRPQLAGGDSMQVVERTDLPSTPGWIPKLTPTRRGDELFLNVG